MASVSSADRARVERRLDPGELLVWAGRPVPTCRFPHWMSTVCGGFSICGLCAFGDFMFLFGSQGRDGWGDMVIFAFVAILFHILALGLLFSPLLHWIRQRMRLYAVTTRRALVLGPFFFAASWSRRRLIPPDRADHCNGLTDIWLVRRGSVSRGNRELEGFTGLATAQADAAFAALSRLRPPFPAPAAPPPAFRCFAPVDQARLDAELDRNETLLWAAHPVPRRPRWTRMQLFVGIPLTLWALLFFALTVWILAAGDLGSRSQILAALAGVLLTGGGTAMLLAFLLFPLRNRGRARATLYAVTDKRAFVLRRSADSWRGAELAAPVVQPSGDGLADLHFAAEETRYGIEPIGFPDLAPADAAAAREALLLIPSPRRTAA